MRVYYFRGKKYISIFIRLEVTAMGRPVLTEKVSQWMEQGANSIWMQTVSNIVVEWDGGN